MEERNWKRLTAVLVVCLLTCSTFALPAEAATDKMKIVAIDLEQENKGEATMISDGEGKSLLVDSGDKGNDSVFRWLDKNGYKSKKFDTLVTHWHDDHAGNTAEIINRYNVGTLYIPSTKYVYSENTKYYQYERGYARRAIAAAKKRGTRIVYLKKGQTIKVGTVKGKVLSVNESPKSENWYDVQYFNNQSSAIMFKGGGANYLTAGDIQAQAENRLLKSGQALEADILKLSHHGYDRSNTQKFIDAVNPAYAYFTSYRSTPGKYIHKDVRDSVTRTGKTANVMGTRYNGTITYVCCGGNIKVGAGRNVRKMYQRLIDKKTLKAKKVTIVYNKAYKVPRINKILNTQRYYNRQVNPDGSMFSGKWMKKNGKYMAASNGTYACNTFAKVKGHTYWFNTGGYRSPKGFISAYGRKYYMTPSRATGFRTINGEKYYFLAKNCPRYKEYLEGKLMDGFFTVGSKTYYAGNRNMEGYRPSMFGVLQKGWTTVNNKLYYLDDDGAVRKGWQTIDGKKYYFDSNGVMQKAEETGDPETENEASVKEEDAASGDTGTITPDGESAEEEAAQPAAEEESAEEGTTQPVTEEEPSEEEAAQPAAEEEAAEEEAAQSVTEEEPAVEETTQPVTEESAEEGTTQPVTEEEPAEEAAQPVTADETAGAEAVEQTRAGTDAAANCAVE